MPGIVGLIVKEPVGIEEKILSDMLDCMLHESFYTHGTFTNSKYGLFIGYAAIKGSFADCMPIFNETKDIVLFLTGECYMDQSTIYDLKNHGHHFNHNNASYIVHLYEEKGDNLFENLNGWYNGIILDLRKSTVTLFNDRYGIRRIYFYEYENGFAFASEAKSLLKVFPELREIDHASIGEFLIYDCILDNKTYFQNISLLPPGSAWSFHNGVVKRGTYIDIDSLENQNRLKRKHFKEELGNTFRRILPRYFSGGRIGLGLTGGLDTRLVLACADPAPGELPCYTFGGSYRDIMDVRIAKRVSKVCQQPHRILRLEDDELLSNYPSYAERSIYISDGLEGADKADVLSFNKMAREIGPIRMTGKYGSQVLKGVVGFQERPPDSRIIAEGFKEYLEIATQTCSQIKKGADLSFLLFCAIPWWWNGFVALETSQIEIRSPFLDNDLINVLYQAPKLENDFGAKFELGLISQTKPELMSIPTTGTFGGNYPLIISKSIKAFIKLLLTLDKIYIREELPFGMTHIVGRIDHALKPLHLDRLVMGFADFRRYRVWFRDQLAEYVQDILLDNKTLSRPYWNKRFLKKIVNDHICGRGTYLREIRKALQIELIHRVLLENSYKK